MSEVYLGNVREACLCKYNRCPDPTQNDWTLPDATVGVYYRYLFQIPGEGTYNFEIVDKPIWVNTYFDSLSGKLRIEGIPDDDDAGETQVIKFRVANCGRQLNTLIITININIVESSMQFLIDYDDADIVDYDGAGIITNP